MHREVIAGLLLFFGHGRFRRDDSGGWDHLDAASSDTCLHPVCIGL